MAELDAESLEARDRRFATKLHARDRSVIAEIDLAFAGPLCGLLKDKLQDADIESVIAESIFDLWNNFRIDRGASVRTLLFQIAFRRCNDVLRKAYNYRELLHRNMELTRDVDLEDHDGPLPQAQANEQREHDRAILVLIESVCNSLTERQETAFRRRYLCGDDTKWAQKLEIETEIPAKNWRKYSDAAMKNVRKILDQHGIEFPEGGRHEVA